MRAVLQRVGSARVTVDDEVVGQIGAPGVLALVGVSRQDGPEQVAWMARKIAELRILDDESSLLDVGGQVLVVSQFTLYGEVSKGRRPSWSGAAAAQDAEPVIADLVRALADRGLQVAQGRFRATMSVELVNDGPFTLILQTPGDRAI